MTSNQQKTEKLSWTRWWRPTEESWVLNWSILEYPSHWFSVRSVFLHTKSSAYDTVEIQVDPKLGILFQVPFRIGRGIYRVAIPNNPETLKMLEEIISYAHQVQERFSEDERIEGIKTLKRNSFLDADTSEQPIQKPR
ncbi:MAG: hypothetical protein IPJ01_07460 [Micavibrio sp.]|nr:hypothetical protein [Micavibrio sp.]